MGSGPFDEADEPLGGVERLEAAPPGAATENSPSAGSMRLHSRENR